MTTCMTPAELRALVEREITTDLPTAARAWGIGKDAAYAAYHDGTLPFPAFKVGRAIKVPTAPLARLLLGSLAEESDTAAETPRVRLASVASVDAGHGVVSGFVNRSGGGSGAA